MNIRSLLVVLICSSFAFASCTSSDDLSQRTSTTEATTTEATTTEATTTEATTTEATTTEATTTEATTTEATTSEESLADDFVRQLVIRTSEFPTATAGSSMKMAVLIVDWVNQVSISGFTEQNLVDTVSMAYDELSLEAQAHFDEVFQEDLGPTSIRFLNGEDTIQSALEAAGGELHPEAMSAESWQGYIDALGYGEP